MKLSFQPYKVLLKRTPYVAVALFLVQTVSGIREGNEVQVEDESDFNVYASDAAMSSSPRLSRALIKMLEKPGAAWQSPWVHPSSAI